MIIMASLYTVLCFLTIPTPILNIQEAGGCSRRMQVQDTTLLAVSNERLVVQQGAPTASVQLKTSKKPPSNSTRKFSLLLDGINVKQLPEGVYEIYITPSDTDQTKLVSESPYFIDVLDTYTIGGTEGKKRILIDITKQFSNLNKGDSPLVSYRVTILFRGNRMPDNTSAQNAGMLIINSVQLLQSTK